MSRFFSERFDSLMPYTPGEQPKDKKYIKLNTNESPFPPSPETLAAAEAELKRLQLYPDPDCSELGRAYADLIGVKAEQVMITNGSDEVLNLAFLAYADEEAPLIMPDITYGFYTSVAEYNRVSYEEIPLKDDFTIDVSDYVEANKTIVIPNPNAPTGIALELEDIEKILASNSDNMVIIDEAYVDFGAESAVSLIDKYENLLVSQTFSKSRSMAGARLGIAIANENVIQDLNTLRYACNPYNVNRVTAALGVAAIKTNSYYENNSRIIAENREYTADRLREMDFQVIPSKSNFLLAKSDRISGEELYRRLKDEKGILIRHFNKERIKEYNRITIGTREDMDAFLKAVEEVLV